MFRRGKLTFLSSKDDRIKLVNERINLTEKHLVELRGKFTDSTRRLAKQRDAHDELAKVFKQYADDEEINECLSEGMKSFTNTATIVADNMDMQVRRLELKIIAELLQCETHCKTTRDALRAAVVARDKEVLKQRQMLEIKSKFAANNSAADSELLKAKLEVNRANKEIGDIINNFEKRKLSDIKTLLTNYTLIAMRYHTKVLEVLSASYYDVSSIDERCDFVEFQKLMKTKADAALGRKVSGSLAKKKKAGIRSQSMEHLERNDVISPLRRSRISRSSKNLADGKAEHDTDDGGEETMGTPDDDDDESNEEEDSDEASTQPDDDDSGSVSDDEDHDETAAATNKRGKAAKSKVQLDPFKTATATTHLRVQQKKKPSAGQ